MRVRESFHTAVTQSDSPHADHMRHLNQELLDKQLPDRPDLRKKLRPDYHPGCKRSVISDDYYPALARSNVSLENRTISSITKEGMIFEGDERPTEFDLIIYSTGFKSLVRTLPVFRFSYQDH